MSEQLRIPELNKMLAIGRITRDLELRFTPGNQAVTSFSIAVNRNYKDSQTGEWKELTSFIPVVVWGRHAERCAERLKKGNAVSIEGRLQSRSWESKQGEKRSTLEVIADRVQFLSKTEGAALQESYDEAKIKDKDADSGNQTSQNKEGIEEAGAKTVQTPSSGKNAWNVDNNADSGEEEIPF